MVFWKARHLLGDCSTAPEAAGDECPLVSHTFRSPEGVGSRVCHPKCVFWDIGYFSEMKSQEKPFTLLLTAAQEVTGPAPAGPAVAGHVSTVNSMAVEQSGLHLG